MTTHISLVHKAHIQVSLSKKLSMNLLAFAYSEAVQISVPSTPVRLFHGLAEQALDLASLGASSNLYCADSHVMGL